MMGEVSGRDFLVDAYAKRTVPAPVVSVVTIHRFLPNHLRLVRYLAAPILPYS